MGRDILSEYGPDKARPPSAPSLSNTQGRAQRDVMNYQPPTGPTNINDAKSPGLHGNNYGVCGTQGPYSPMSGQGGGKPGIGGDRTSMGSNRKG